MKWLIASDIHGSAYYAERLVQAFHKEEADKILLLGDILYHGPRNDLPKEYNPKKVIGLLNPLKNLIFCVRGNCEAEVDQMVLDFPILADYAVLVDGKITIYATHGHIYNEQHLPPMGHDCILLHGHTHVPKCIYHEAVVDEDNQMQVPSYVYMNPGSVSIPKEGSHHGYMLWEGSSFTWKNLDGQTIHRYDAYSRIGKGSL